MSSASRKHILIMAGGTGGHVYPALATAQHLRDADIEVEWLGTRKGIEARLAPEAGITLHCLSITGIRGKRLAVLVKAPFLLVLALGQALRVCLRFKPDCVLGMGGFASGPGGLAAWLLRIPLVIQEQNAVPGTTNRILAHFARQVLEGFEGAFGLSRARFSGNPVREAIMRIAPPEQRYANRRGPLKLLVVGGSLGAQALNQVVPEALASLPPVRRPSVWHQTGAAHYATTQALYQQHQQRGLEARVAAYIEDMAEAYAWADIVLCRAGALTVAELAAAGLASVLVPYPHAIDDHQTSNAQWLVERGAAVLLPQPQLSAARLVELLENWNDEPATLLLMARQARACAKPDAAKMVADCCKELAYE